MEERQKEELKAKGNKALLMNVIFFLVLFVGILLATTTGLVPTVIIITLVFVASLLYIYLS